jgi:hypothetical protein
MALTKIIFSALLASNRAFFYLKQMSTVEVKNVLNGS